MLRLKSFYIFLLFFGSAMLRISFAQINLLMDDNFGYKFINKFTTFTNESLETKELSSCEKQLANLSYNVKQNKLWALKFIDAWAKVPAGIFYGRGFDMGNFDECLSLSEREGDELYMGKYCYADIELDINSTYFDSFEGNFALGICIPAVCSAGEVEILLKKYFKEHFEESWKNSSLTIKADYCAQKDRVAFNNLDWIAVATLILLGSLMLLSTTYDYFTTNQGKTLNPLYAAFSVRSNMRQLMQMTSPTDTPKHIIPALDGIRCLSMISIVYFHSAYLMLFQPNLNEAEIDVWGQGPTFLIWRSSANAVDTFFFLSGFLIISGAFREMKKKSGKLNIPLMYLHRFIRLSPVLYLAVLLFMTLFRFLGDGPIWGPFASGSYLCHDTWWATLFYVSNFFNENRMCFGHTWYLSADTQLYILSPIALILLWKWRRWGVAALIFIGLLLIAVLFGVIVIGNLIVFCKTSDHIDDSVEMSLTYYYLYARVSPWIIGIIFGYFMHNQSGRRIILSKFIVLCGWFISLAMFLVVVFALYPKTQPGANLITPLEGALYLTLSRVAWPLGLCWLIFACVNGYAGLINSFLSCKIWQPLSKLSYSMYIWHMFIVLINDGRVKTNPRFSDYDVILHFWNNFGVTLLLAIVAYLAAEAPMLGIEKILLAKKPQVSPNKDLPLVIN